MRSPARSTVLPASVALASAREIPPEYGQAYGMYLCFHTRSGETPVLRMLWIRENGVWRISVYGVEYP